MTLGRHDIDTDKNESLNVGTDSFLLFYDPKYLSLQPFKHLFSFENDSFESHFDIEDDTATSIPFSPFGGIKLKKPANLQDFHNYMDGLIMRLKGLAVKKITLKAPPAYYANFVPLSWLEQHGFQTDFTDTNQFVDLKKPIELHQMQNRKLRRAHGFNIRNCPLEEFPAIHQFIANCRKAQNLTINISLEKLQNLVEQFPDRYEAFVAERNGQIASAVILAYPAAEVAYYYLPATHPDFKKDSPMVPLLNHIYHHCKKLDYLYFDLGISSIEGTIQASLAQFKTRMGASSSVKPQMKLNL
ncbi:MAG: GNAT family N-acetyltransferase [Cyclobacteriaceae bacterium]